MRWIFTFFLFLKLALVNAQKEREPLSPDYKGLCNTSFPKFQLAGKSEDDVAAYLKKAVANLSEEGNEVKLNYIKESPGGYHYSFTQTYYGLEVYQSELKVNLDKKNVVRSVFDNSFNTRHWKLDAVDKGPSNSVVCLTSQGNVVIAQKTLINGYETLLTNGEVIFERDTRSYSALPDSLVSILVFNPDPLTTLQQPYTNGVYDDNNDSNSPWLNNQLQPALVAANFTGSDFRLENSFVKIVDVDSPNVLAAVSTIPQFHFNRSQTGFEDVHAFYHLNNYRAHVQQLGFSLANSLIIVDTHAWSGSDQSSFTPNSGNPELDFGTGGVDDAEDADVLVHEYAHFLSYNASPGSNIGNERNSLDEAFGDYTAASYSAALSAYNKDWVFNWDGPVWSNNSLGGRTVASTKVYPTDLVSGIYKNAPIWSTALMNIHNEIGRAATDSLIYQAHYSYAANISMADAAQLLLDADTLLNNGAYYCPIYKHLLARGLVNFYAGNPCGISSVNNEELTGVSFISKNSSFTVNKETEELLQVTLYNLAGQKIMEHDLSHSSFTYSNNNLLTGIYLIELKAESTSKTFKWVKTE
jgi:hypothetical protein